jgi:hypothetical protein
VDALGYSMGGGVALKFAARHPERVRRLALVSTAYSTDGFYAEMRPMQSQVGAAMAPMMVETPMYQGYIRVAPDTSEFPRLLDAMGALMRRELDWSEDVRSLAMPTMIVFGDSDMFRPEHIVEMYQLLGGGLRDAGWQRETISRNRLAIIPDATHYDIFFSPLLVPTVLPFLNGESHARSWAEQVSGEATGSVDHRAAIESYYRAYRERDRAALERLLTDDFRFRSSFGAFDGRDAMLDAIWPAVGRSWAVDLEIHGTAPEYVVTYRHGALAGVEHPLNRMAERIRFEGDRIAEIEVFLGPELEE